MPTQIIQLDDEPYHKAITSYVHTAFPHSVKPSSSQLLDLLTDEIVGTNSIRLGPKPSPESLVAIRSIIKLKMAEGRPIAFSVPWGSEKPDSSGIDIAELSALKTLGCLNERIKRHYSPGASFGIRFEDSSAAALFKDENDQVIAYQTARRYVVQFETLVDILELNSVQSLAESKLVSPATFVRAVEGFLPIFINYLDELCLHELGQVSGSTIAALSDIGWSAGGIKAETAWYYLNQYNKLYPQQSFDQHIEMLARYFCSALVRHKLGLRSGAAEWSGKFIDLAFCQSPPGVDDYLSKRVIYRTLPTCYTTQHLPAWRAKGYLLINSEDRACPKLASFNHPQEYNKHSFALTNNNKQVNIQSDYILA